VTLKQNKVTHETGDLFLGENVIQLTIKEQNFHFKDTFLRVI